MSSVSIADCDRRRAAKCRDLDDMASVAMHVTVYCSIGHGDGSGKRMVELAEE